MAVRIKFDSTHNVITPTLVLATRSGRKLGPIPAVNITVSDSFNSRFELEFQVHKMDNGVEYAYWDKLTDFKLVWCKEWDVWFEMYVTVQDDNDTVKQISCVSVGEAELSQVNLYDIQINTEDDIARDDYEITVLYNKEKPAGSLLHRIMEKVPHYTVEHVDASIAGIQRTFTFSGTSLYDAFQTIAEEIDCIFVIDSSSNEDGSIKRSISVYDLESYCNECGTRGNFQDKCEKCGSTNIRHGYGEDTTIFVSTENLADNITLKVNTDSVKNCFRLEAGDDLMTATVRNSNPNGSQYIWYISDEMKEDMSEELVAKLEAYDKDYETYCNKHEVTLDEGVLNAYNALVEKYHKYDPDLRKISSPIVGYAELMNGHYDTIDFYLYLHDGLMPSPELAEENATNQAAKLTSAALSPVAVQNKEILSTATASNAVLSMAKTIVSPNFQVKVKEGNLEGNYWTGSFTVTSYADEEDKADSETVRVEVTDDYEKYVKQRIDKVLNSTEIEHEDLTDIATIFKQELDRFKEEMQKYCLVSLQTFHDACQSCVDILIEQGIADRNTWANKRPDLYIELYTPYRDKLDALAEEIKLREEELAQIDALQKAIAQECEKIQDKLNFEKYLGEDLWLEFVAYRREDTYSNENYISDGLNNAELFQNALEFLETARKEIYKSATQQHSLSASLKNLLVMKEFLPIVDMFEVGNWIRIKIDDNIYRLRLISYTIDFEDLSNISVEFSDVEKYRDGVTDSADIFKQAQSMASTYGAVSRQSTLGKKSSEQLDNWVEKGMDLTKVKIIDNADNQNIMFDEHGLLCREYLPIQDEYSEKQLKVINRGLYVTDDDWRTSKAGIGDFTFWNPETKQYEDAYGVVADTLVGNLILSEKVGVYNTGSSVTLGENGLVITADGTDAGVNRMVMTVQRKTVDADGNEVLTPVMYLDGDGNLVLTGTVKVQTGTNSSVGSINDICDDARLDTRIQNRVMTSENSLREYIDERHDDAVGDARSRLDGYKAEVGQYMQFDENGLSLGAKGSNFKTVIDNKGMYFREGSKTVAYINNDMLYIPDAVIENTLTLGNFFFSPREDGGVSLVWKNK